MNVIHCALVINADTVSSGSTLRENLGECLLLKGEERCLLEEGRLMDSLYGVGDVITIIIQSVKLHALCNI